MREKSWNIALCLVSVLVLMSVSAGCGHVLTAGSAAAATAAAESTSTAGSRSAVPESVQLTVFAAASLTETVTGIADMYRRANPNVTITLNFDSSGTLKTQIQEGAACDIFISAAQKQMDQLDASKIRTDNPDGLDFLEQGTRVNLLENKVALVVPDGNPKGIRSFSDLAGKLRAGGVLMAMGNSDVPVGQYTRNILAWFKLNEETLANAGAITYASNVKEVTTQVKEASADCGVVYCTDAYSAGLTVIDTATPEMCGRVTYPAAVLNISRNKEAARRFLDYLKTDECMKVFAKAGFSPAP